MNSVALPTNQYHHTHNLPLCFSFQPAQPPIYLPCSLPPMKRFGPTPSATPTTPKHAPTSTKFVDCHHHFLNPLHNPFQSFLGKLVQDTYLTQHYDRDVVQPLQHVGVKVVGSVHVECMPDDGVAEAAWVAGMAPATTVKAIVASCDLSQPLDKVDAQLRQLTTTVPQVRGIRWILDYDGAPWQAGDPMNATHVATTRHSTHGDYLRMTFDNGATHVLPAFVAGFALLAKYNLSFDLQCAPSQLAAAATLMARHPDVPVAIDHLGKPRIRGNNINSNTNQACLQEWRQGMQLMAALPHVYCKISMLGFVWPDWYQHESSRTVIADLVREVVALFGPRRCMVGLNWWKDAATSDADGLSDTGPSPVEFWQFCANDCFADYSEEDRHQLFSGTAQRFYRIAATHDS